MAVVRALVDVPVSRLAATPTSGGRDGRASRRTTASGPLDPRQLEAFERACRGAATELALFENASQRLRAVLPFDGAAWFATDPTTLLGTNAVRVENVEAGHCETYWQRECMVEDALLFRDLARSPQGVGTLYAATNGQPARSARYREYLAPQGYGDELEPRSGSAGPPGVSSISTGSVAEPRSRPGTARWCGRSHRWSPPPCVTSRCAER